MIYRSPSYCGKFRCIADKCTDNCCIGWEIDIDSETLRCYESVSGDFGKRLKENISDGCFVLGEGERCPFLNSRNLCDIFTELGEENLCQICTDHPRYYEWFGTVKEGGIGLCCEEAARIILSNDLELTEMEVPDEECVDYDEELFQFLLSARDVIISHLQTDSLNSAMGAMLDFAEKLQFRIDNGSYSLPEFVQVTEAETPDVQGILSFFTVLEPIDEKWQPYIKSCMEFADKVGDIPHEHEVYLRRLAVYFIFRYFMKGTFDGEILSRVKLAAVSVWMISYLWRCRECPTFEDMAQTAKNYSKEVEYSEENLDTLADGFYDAGCFRTARILGLK